MVHCKWINQYGIKCSIKNAIFGYKNGVIEYCFAHKKENMINIKHYASISGKCIENDCNKRANFNLQNETKPLYCTKHKKDNMINILSNKCIEKGCTIVPSFNLPDEKKAIYCSNHKKHNMVNVISVKCNQNGCNKLPSYNLPTEINGIYCKEHKKENMIDVKNNNKCIELNCLIRPTYNIPSALKPLYCNEHKKENMINIVSKKCIAENCDCQPIYNLSTENNGIYCKEHKKENMINVIDIKRNKNNIDFNNICKKIKCIEDNCTKYPSFNISSEKKGLYCKEHKKENMVDVTHKRCIQDNCNKLPSYNYVTEKKKLYCFEHKKDNMINIGNIICIENNCNKRASFNNGYESKPLYCFEHKKDNMISISNKKCQEKKCKNDAIFGLIHKKPQFCSTHKKSDMINLNLENKCSIIDCNDEYNHIIENIKYCNNHIPENSLLIVKRLCKYCDIKENSTYVCKECKKIQNKKEWSIVRYLRKNIDTTFEYNSSKMLDGCSKKRPDIYFELLKHCVIVEIDEHQHNTYGDSCECARLNEIVNGIGGKSVIIIRFNPDNIKHKNIKINIKQIERINLLVKIIKDELTKDYNNFIVKIIQLYYDDNYEIYNEIKEEDITKIVSI
jgi:hypothetical protein